MAYDIFQLVGTPNQNAIVEDALRRTNFPFELLKQKLYDTKGKSTIPVEWLDLSTFGAVATEAAAATDGHEHDHDVLTHTHDQTLDNGYDVIEYRNRVLGLAWYSGKVSIDLSLESDPELAKEVFLAEGAHMVDFFYMTDEMRRIIFNAFHNSVEDVPEHGHDWFDMGSYYDYVGEAFMGGFIKAFSDLPVTIPFNHEITELTIQRIRYALLPEQFPEGQPDEPVEEPVPEEPEVTPQPEPETPFPEEPHYHFFSKQGSKVFHDSHSGIAQDIRWANEPEALAAGLRPCKVCKPKDHA